jgi:hypothetical protein
MQHDGSDEMCIQNNSRKTLRKRLLGRPGRRWEDNIKVHLKETGYEGTNWIQVTTGSVHRHERSDYKKGGKFLTN